MPAIDNARLSVGQHVVEGVVLEKELAEFEKEGGSSEEERGKGQKKRRAGDETKGVRSNSSQTIKTNDPVATRARPLLFAPSRRQD